MKKEILQQYLNNILNNIAAVNELTEHLAFHEFVREEQVKEEVYARLQEIGQVAYEIELSINGRLDLEFDIDVLTSFKDIRFHKAIEQAHPSVWSLIKGSFKNIANQIEESTEHLHKPTQQ